MSYFWMDEYNHFGLDLIEEGPVDQNYFQSLERVQLACGDYQRPRR
jgi:hypothetical protein